jgi:hypothetical protein
MNTKSMVPFTFVLSLATLLHVSATQAYAGDAPEAPAVSGETAEKTGVALGLQLQRFQDDFGLGATFVSPAFGPWVRWAATGGVAWYPHAVRTDGMLGWEAFYHGRVTVEVGPPFRGDSIVRPYGFGGAVMLGLPGALSKDSLAYGGVGGFGFEFRFRTPRRDGPVTYFMELGAIGTNAKASRFTTNESIASGFLIAAGFRGYPWE